MSLTERVILIDGHSDDILHVNDSEYYPGDEAIQIGFSDGTLLTAKYGGDGTACWRINRIKAGTAEYEKYHEGDPDDDYTDRVRLTGQFSWYLVGDKMETFK